MAEQPKCGKLLPKAQEPCGRIAEHAGSCKTAAAVDRNNKNRGHKVHCAKFSDALLPVAVEMLKRPRVSLVLDPFAGTGKGVDYLRSAGFTAWGIDLEPEWADLSSYVMQGDALALQWPAGYFDAVFTSPTYGNRMADKDLRASVAGTYAKSLGRHASEGSSCHLQWGEPYRVFHRAAWAEAWRVLRPGGYFLLNIKNHIRAKVEVDVSGWHVRALEELGFVGVESRWIPTPSLRNGQNGGARVEGEWLVLMQR